MNNKKFIAILSLVAFVGVIFIYIQQGVFTKKKGPDYGVDKTEALEDSEGYGVSASHPLAVDAGMKVLENGGNAVDAAITTAYVLGVVEPYGSGIGGGGVALINNPKKEEPVVYEYREQAPIAGLNEKSFAIPGFVKGMEEMHEAYGSIPLDKLIEPAVNIASEGFEINSQLANRFERAANRMDTENMPDYFPDYKLLETNDVLKQPELAETLKLIQTYGSDVFYKGTISEALIDFIPELRSDDFTDFKVNKTKPVSGQFGDYTVYSAPPPFAGITLVQMLEMIEELNIQADEEDPVQYIHKIGAASNRAYSDRLTNTFDPEFYPDKSYEEIASIDYAKKMIANFNPDKIGEVKDINDSKADTDDYDNTTHFVVIDKSGMMFSATNTLGDFFGSGEFIAGFFLNNQVDNFSTTQDSVNYLEHKKVPRSFTSPSIIKSDSQLIGLGTPGGKRIPAVMSDILTRALLFEHEWDEVISKKRFYVEGRDIFTETELAKSDQASLRAKGYEIYHVADPNFYGGMQGIIKNTEENVLFGIADSRRQGMWQVSNE